jgi:hypothetical protein
MPESDDLGRAWAWRNRGLTALAVAGALGAAAFVFPDAARRGEVQYLCVLSLGYGHLLGALAFSRERLASCVARGVPPALFWSFVASSAASAFAVYSLALRAAPLLLLPLLAIATWHTAENDLALGRAYREGFRLPPLPRSPRHHAVSIAATAAVLLAAGLAPPWRGWIAAEVPPLAPLLGRLPPSPLAFSDVFAAATGWHLLSWLLFLWDRARACERDGQPQAAAALRRGLLVWHAAPIAVCALLAASEAAPLAPLRAAVFAPGLYLYGSMLHVLQTALLRGLEPRPVRSMVAGAA